MNKLMHTFWSPLKSNIWLIAAFLVPLAIRSIPELLSWPYPLGLDTLRYIQTIESGVSLASASSFVHFQLFYPMATVLYWLVGNAIIIIKILGPILMGSVAVMMYLYALKGLGWSNFKSFFAALLLSIYFVSLRNSWDLYAQSLALIFLFATLIVLKSSNSPKRFLPAAIFMLLTVLAHQLVSVILFVILGLEAIRKLIVGRQLKDFLFTFIALGLAGALFLFRTYSPTVGSVVVPSANVTSTASVNLGLYMAGLLLYCYFLLLPFAAVGVLRLKDWVLRFWVVWCVGVVVLLMVAPDLPLYYWNRWVYLLVYPLLFFTVEGLDRLWHFCVNHKVKVRRLAPKAIALGYVILLATLSGFYVATPPENQVPLFSSVNPYLSYIPSSMVQNMLPIQDNSYLVGCLNWVTDNVSDRSVIVAHYAIYDLIKIYDPGLPVVPVSVGSMWAHIQNQTTLVDGMIDASKAALDAGNSTVYTIWWINGEGWYSISSLPSDFQEVHRSGEIAVYIFKATSE